MNPVSALPAIAAIALALITANIISRLSKAPPKGGRFDTIDGLRGYLALFVFLHHSSIWYFYLRTGRWETPPSNLYTHFGQDSVALFFMITSFLFFTKILNQNRNAIDFSRIYVGRILRLFPLYAFAVLIMMGVIIVLSKFEIHRAPWALSKELLKWVTFTIFGAPTINAIAETNLIVAGVTWSLPYEWFFYLCLPALAFVAGHRPPRVISAFGIASVLAFVAWKPNVHHIFSFGLGIASAYLVRFRGFRSFAKGRLATFFICTALSCLVALFPTAYDFEPLVLLAIAFSLIAGGNAFFGVLSSTTSKALGELTYSLYLLHGIALFVTFTFVIDREQAAQLSPDLHWLIILVLCPTLVLICRSTFLMIEAPALARTNQLLSWLKGRIVTKTRITVRRR